MKKSQGPAFKKAVIELAQCPLCRGRAVTQGVFHELPCEHCNASGWVVASTGGSLTLDELVTQLSMRLQSALRQIEQLKDPQASWPEETYQGCNRRGAGGTNYTGD
ncbi:hypothetical protein [Pseudomonas sp. NBRC 111119]|uniref:hypothetical protein n=1 Tax=Pseudomonas sp. NBRC 111119 TaxID=1661034 RepID=UPI0007618C97|nr:hypothetical protein [Pseudomonas sp. NBRC 111119]